MFINTLFNYMNKVYNMNMITEQEAYKLFDLMLDDTQELVSVCGYTYPPSYALRELDPTAYQCEFLDYIDSMREEFEVEGC